MAKKLLLDPVANAGFLAFLFFLFAFIRLLDFINGEITLAGGIMGLFYLIAGIGLRKQKLWGVYGVGILPIITLISIFNYGISSLLLVSFSVEILLFFWLYSAKDKFKK